MRQKENALGDRRKILQAKMIPYFFILPAFIVHVSIVTGPAISTLVMSLFDWNGMVTNNLKWLMIFITVPIFLGFMIAILISNLKWGQMLFRSIFFLPYVISAAVAGKIWTAYMNPYYGLNIVFEKFGWLKLASTQWLGNPKISLFSVAFVDNWHWWGFVMVLFLGALQQVDQSLYEAAKIDGANRFQEVIHVAIPGIQQTIAFVLIMTIMWSFLTFDYVFIMTNGGPANATEIMSTWIYKNAFTKYRAGYANAL
jgi:raffinose/stachyose/melibiose transport system permease protein